MKTKIKLPAILVGLLLLLTGTTQNVMAQNDDVSLQSFYDELSPYGQWIKDPQYGYVWRPDVDQEEFRPYYTNGRWVMTEYGNTWVSNYDWGWAPFHYGRWVYNRYNNWIWIPDTVWGPAWVSWRSGGGYYGWAPLGPSISIGINIGRGGYRIPDMCWNFIPYNNIYYNSYPRYYGNRNRIYIQNTVIINNTYVRNNRTYYTGPRADDIRRATNQRVTVYNVNRDSRPGASRIANNSVNIYTPRPVRGSANTNASPRDAVQGSINRGVVGRDNNVNASRGERGTGNTMNTYPSRDREVNTNQPSRGDSRSNGTMNTNPSREGNGVPSQIRPQQSAERGRDIPQQPQQRMERPQAQERSERVQAPQQQMPQRTMEGKTQPQQQQAPQRTERTQRSQPQAQPQRVERTQSPPSQRSSGGRSESRGSRGGESNGGGRVRGGG
ncbi:DUF6600 domain-containing protein [Pedobacter sp. Du54]|uniref:DUF6600 domain-containing protein n=1 Tax=Pedobacter anseongensis TaxID=3133439 RepID=UPI0030A67CAB